MTEHMYTENQSMEHGVIFTIPQKGKPPIVVTRNVGGEVIFTRTEFSIRIGVHTSTLRTWEKKKMLVPAYVNDKGIRYYTEAQAQQYLKAHQKGKHNSRRV